METIRGLVRDYRTCKQQQKEVWLGIDFNSADVVEQNLKTE